MSWFAPVRYSPDHGRHHQAIPSQRAHAAHRPAIEPAVGAAVPEGVEMAAAASAASASANPGTGCEAVSSTMSAGCRVRGPAAGAGRRRGGAAEARSLETGAPASAHVHADLAAGATSRAAIVRPRPVPPYFLVVEASSCSKGRKIAACFPCGMPMPVSLTLKCSSTSAACGLAMHRPPLSRFAAEETHF